MEYALNKVKTAWSRYGREVTLSFGVILVGIIGFETGLAQGQSMQSDPLVIEVPAAPADPRVSDPSATSDVSGNSGAASPSDVSPNAAAPTDKDCVFVGSRNSDKYHHPTCSFAKRIKPENRVCFSSEEDAKSKGYTAGCLK